MYGVNLVTPLFFQGPLHLGAFDAGVYLVQGAVATGITMLIVGELTKRFDTRIAASAVLSRASVSTLVHAGGLHAAAARLAGMIVSDASLISYLYLFRVSALIFAVCLPLLLLLPRSSRA